MKTFLLHSGEPGVKLLLERLQIPHGTRLTDGVNYKIVIQWGERLQERAGQRRLNPVACILRALHKKTSNELLQLHGIKTAAAETSGYSTEYLVPVFHLKALAVFAKNNSTPLLIRKAEAQKQSFLPLLQQFQELDLTVKGFHVHRAMREAAKSVYALGLDSALVHIGISPQGHTIVVEIQPTPSLNIRLAELFAEAIHRFDAALALERDEIPNQSLKLGADPEFILRGPNGRITSASRFMEREGKVGCDAVILAQQRVILPLAELRPDPSSDPRVLVERLRSTMRLAARMIPNQQLAWLAGGMPAKGLPLGGHIHFSGLWLNSHLLRALDNYLSLPLVMIEAESAGRRRPRYGFLGDYRTKSYGGFEYRSLPSWLVSPEIASGVLCLARLIADHYRELTSQPLQHLDVQKAFYGVDKMSLLSIVRELWQDIEALTSYSGYQSELLPLKEQMLRMDSWEEQTDFRRAWKIPPFHQKSGNSTNFMV